MSKFSKSHQNKCKSKSELWLRTTMLEANNCLIVCILRQIKTLESTYLRANVWWNLYIEEVKESLEEKNGIKQNEEGWKYGKWDTGKSKCKSAEECHKSVSAFPRLFLSTIFGYTFLPSFRLLTLSSDFLHVHQSLLMCM